MDAALAGGTLTRAELLVPESATVDLCGMQVLGALLRAPSTVMASRSVAYRGAALWTRDYRPTCTTADMAKDKATDMALAAVLARSFGVTLPVGCANPQRRP